MAPLSVLIVVLAPELVRVLLGGGWDPVVDPLRVLALGLVCRTGYKISDSLARSAGTVYKRAWRQGIYAAPGRQAARWSAGSGASPAWPGACSWPSSLNYAAMSSLSIATTGLSWRRFFAAHVRGAAAGRRDRRRGAPRRPLPAGRRRRRSRRARRVQRTGRGHPRAPGPITSPGLMLGRDGQWLLRKVRSMGTGRRSRRAAKPAAAGGWLMDDGPKRRPPRRRALVDRGAPSASRVIGTDGTRAVADRAFADVDPAGGTPEQADRPYRLTVEPDIQVTVRPARLHVDGLAGQVLDGPHS